MPGGSVVIAGPNCDALARKVSRKMGASFSRLVTKNFPDGELYVRIKADVKGKRVVIVSSMHPSPNLALLTTVFAVHTAKRLGAKKVIVVSPYLAFMRQDKEFHKGECISAHVMARLLDAADAVYAIDPHLHRIKDLQDIFSSKGRRLSANDVLAKYIRTHHPKSIIIGPDEESYQWAEMIAQKVDRHAVMLRKKRYTSYSVRIKLKEDVDFKGRNVVIVDDIISTGHTMVEPIRQLKRRGVKHITCVCIHGVFAEGALKMLRGLGAKVVSTNTIPNPVSKIDVSSVISETLT